MWNRSRKLVLTPEAEEFFGFDFDSVSSYLASKHPFNDPEDAFLANWNAIQKTDYLLMATLGANKSIRAEGATPGLTYFIEQCEIEIKRLEPAMRIEVQKEIDRNQRQNQYEGSLQHKMDKENERRPWGTPVGGYVPVNEISRWKPVPPADEAETANPKEVNKQKRDIDLTYFQIFVFHYWLEFSQATHAANNTKKAHLLAAVTGKKESYLRNLLSSLETYKDENNLQYCRQLRMVRDHFNTIGLPEAAKLVENELSKWE